MYLETLLNQTFQRYETQKIAVFRKQSLPIKIRQIQANQVIGELSEKCDADYYGIYLGKFIAIEAKQTNKNNFNYQQIQEHQQNYLQLIHDCGGLSYLVIYFEKPDEFHLIEFYFLRDFHENHHTNQIPLSYIKTYGRQLRLYFPGYLDLIKNKN